MKRPSMAGWSAVGISTMTTSLWAFWGTFEAFHEGWYFRSPSENLICTAKYLTPMLVFLVLSMIPLRWPRIGGSLYLLFGIGFAIYIYMRQEHLNFSTILGFLPMTLPPLLVGGVFWLGRPTPVSCAFKISIIVPLAVAIGFGIEPILRIASRVECGGSGPRLVRGNGLNLIWAPEGPGWLKTDPHDRSWINDWRGPTWEEAIRTCRYLTADGKGIADAPQDIWRLPTVEEIVRSMTRHGINCMGVWDPIKGCASYCIKPDKEPPLWNQYSVIIYYWTSSQQNSKRAYCIDFNGNVYSRDKNSHMGSQAFRAVRDPQ